ncbi:NB-ARC domain-containing disease resistance protein, partial [Prunus dulcis]
SRIFKSDLLFTYSTGETASSHINIIIKDLQVLIKGVDDKPAPPFKGYTRKLRYGSRICAYFCDRGILKKLISLAAQEISLAWGCKAELNRLRKTLSTLKGPQGRSKSVEDWVTNLKRLAQDADDVLDEFNYELLRRKVEIRNHMKKKKINASLVNLKSEAPIIGLVSKKTDAAPQGIRGRIQTDSLPEKDGIIVGRKEVVSDLVTTLTNSNIIKKIYLLWPLWEWQGWERQLWPKSLNPSKATVRENQDALLIYLEEELREKKYLLVLDDVWNEDSEKWESLMSYLSKLNSAPGSKIIVTTRSGIVASLTETLPRPELELLSTDECWSILKHAACSDGSSDIPLGLERIGREIAKNCEGLPLMAKVLGGILRSKKTPAEWSEVKDSRIWDLPKAEDRIISLFQNATVDDDGIVTECKMHDLVHDLAESVSETESMMRDFHNEDVATPIIERIPEGSSGKLRSLFSNAEALLGNMLPWFKALRVLKLYDENIEELPSSIGKLKHLRYLDISFTEIKRLPNSIGKLYNLQTLRATNCSLKEFPKAVQNLINLRYVYCDKGTKFPAGVLRRLTSLRKLSCSLMGSEIEELAALNQLKGKLIIRNLEDVRNGDEASKAKLEEKKKVRHFLFEWTQNRSTTNNNEEDVLEGLQPHSELERLAIQFFMGTKFPSWMIKLDNLKKIKLKGCNRFEEVQHSAIYLILQLESLVSSGPVYIVELLNIIGCGGLQSIPDLNLFTPLRELRIESCDRLESLLCNAPSNYEPRYLAMSLLKERCNKNSGPECPKISHIPISTLWISEVSSCTLETVEHLNKKRRPSSPRFLIFQGSIGYTRKLRYGSRICAYFCDRENTDEADFPCCSRNQSCLGFKAELNRLRKTLSTIQGYLADVAQGPQGRSKPVEDWVTNLKRLAQDADDVLDEFNYELLRRKVEIRNHMKKKWAVNVVELLIIGCSGLQSIPDLNLFTFLRDLSIGFCDRLESLVSSGPVNVVELLIRGCSGLQSIPDLNLFTSLRDLSIESCDRLESLVSSGPVNFVELLNITGCSGLQSIPDLNLFTSLRDLSIESCDRLESLVSSGPVNVVELLITGCSGLQSIPDLNLFTSLRDLSIESCDRLESLGKCTNFQRQIGKQTFKGKNLPFVLGWNLATLFCYLEPLLWISEVSSCTLETVEHLNKKRRPSSPRFLIFQGSILWISEVSSCTMETVEHLNKERRPSSPRFLISKGAIFRDKKDKELVFKQTSSIDPALLNAMDSRIMTFAHFPTPPCTASVPKVMEPAHAPLHHAFISGN